MIAKVHSAAYLGIDAYAVSIEVDVSHGLPQLNVVGLPDTSIKEARERVRAAIKNSGYSFPADRITVNLAPADIKKEGSSFDLPIALGILAAHEVLPLARLQQYLFLGELALDGSLRAFKGALIIANSLGSTKPFVFPELNAREACLQKDAKVYGVKTLREVVEFLQEERELTPVVSNLPEDNSGSSCGAMDFADVKGQEVAKRALEIAVAGGHNVLLIGSPGAGKTMLARRIPSILPPLTFEETLEITKIYSAAGHLLEQGVLMTAPPFRSPHYSISPAALAGGGSWPKPGEVSLAHHGILFLDEFPEFRRDVIETLRTPLEDGQITISRAKKHVTYPSIITLVASMNPCPCGYLTDTRRKCRCSLSQIQKYQMKISGPILDRIDLHIEVPALTYQTLKAETPAEFSFSIRERIIACRNRQAERFLKYPFRLNARMGTREIKLFARLSSEGEKLLESAMKELRLSARAYYKILKLARTIADLEGSDCLAAGHIAEAIQYRSLDRQWWH